MKIWRKGDYYRYSQERFQDDEAKQKNTKIVQYLVVLICNIEKLFENNIPEQLQDMYNNIKRSILNEFGKDYFSELRKSIDLIED